MTLTGKRALVTGSTRGLGKAIAFALGGAGAHVVFNFANNEELAESTFSEYRAAGYEGTLARADVASEEGVNGLAEAIGGIDILVPNATPDQPQLPLEEYTWQQVETMLDFFVRSPFLLTRTFVPAMKARRWGRIVHITSEAFERGMANFSAYVAAKGGQTGLARSGANELSPHGITVNTVSPGWIPVERHADDPQSMKDAYLATIPRGRWGTPEDVAHAVLFFCQPQSGFITGQTLCVDGGTTQPR